MSQIRMADDQRRRGASGTRISNGFGDVQTRLLALHRAHRSVVNATNAYKRKLSDTTHEGMRSKKTDFKLQLDRVIGSVNPSTADGLVQAGEALMPVLEQLFPATTTKKQQEARFRSSAAVRVHKGHRHGTKQLKDGRQCADGMKSFSITSNQGVDLFQIEATPNLAVEVFVVTWKLVEYARRAEAARKLGKHQAETSNETDALSESQPSPHLQNTEEMIKKEPIDSEETDTDDESLVMAARLLLDATRVPRRACEDNPGRASDCRGDAATAAGAAGAAGAYTPAAAHVRAYTPAAADLRASGATIAGAPANSVSSSVPAPETAGAGHSEHSPSLAGSEKAMPGPLKELFNADHPTTTHDGTSGASQHPPSSSSAGHYDATAETSSRARDVAAFRGMLSGTSGGSGHPWHVSSFSQASEYTPAGSSRAIGTSASRGASAAKSGAGRHALSSSSPPPSAHAAAMYSRAMGTPSSRGTSGGKSKAGRHALSSSSPPPSAHGAAMSSRAMGTPSSRGASGRNSGAGRHTLSSSSPPPSAHAAAMSSRARGLAASSAVLGGTSGAGRHALSSSSPVPPRYKSTASDNAVSLATSLDAPGGGSGASQHHAPSLSLLTPSGPASILPNRAGVKPSRKRLSGGPRTLPQASISTSLISSGSKGKRAGLGRVPAGRQGSSLREKKAKVTGRLYGGGSLDGGRVNAGSVVPTASSSLLATDSGVAAAPAGNDLTPMQDAAVSAAAAAVSACTNDAAIHDGGRFGNASASLHSADLVPEGAQESLLSVERAVEYRWPNDGQWYRCKVVSILPGVNGNGEAVELAYLPPKNIKTKRVRKYTEKLEVAQLLADGDVAKPGEHLDWN